jgi:phosphoribosylformylglycinamidine (FGAM) synthase-like enzyme
MNGTSTKGVEPYDLMRESSTWFKNTNPINNQLLMFLKQINEHIPYETFSSHMEQFKNEQITIVDDILH